MSRDDNARFFERTIALTIMALLFLACFQILRPFLGALLWGIIIAVSTWRPYLRLVAALHGRRKLAAFVMSFILFLILVIPVSLLVSSAADGVRIRLDNLAEENWLTIVADAEYTNSGEGLHRYVDPADGEVE